MTAKSGMEYSLSPNLVVIGARERISSSVRGFIWSPQLLE
jgi:hypothetical protein